MDLIIILLFSKGNLKFSWDVDFFRYMWYTIFRILSGGDALHEDIRAELLRQIQVHSG